MKYRPEIDGLRALAVLPVIFFHAGFEGFSGGYVGVDVFFVISGYLITSIIISELAEDRFSIVNFYERRARRILPALFFVMLACLPFAWFWLIPSDLRNFGQSLVAVSSFSSNILFWRESGYFDTAAELKPLLHTWSLAVEEQYYILFPVFLVLAWRLGTRWIMVLLSLLFVASLGVAHWATSIAAGPKAASGAFYLLPARGWELLIGVFAAFHLERNAYPGSRMLNQVLSLGGFGMIVYSIVAFDENTPFPGLYALVPTVGTVLLILSAVPGTVVHKLLSYSPVVGIGLVSYSAYLWHQPMLAFARHRSPGEVPDAVLLALCLASLVLAYVSWRWVEKPFRDRRRTTRRQVFWFSAIGIACFGAIGLKTHFWDGYPGRLDSDLDIQTMRASPLRNRCHSQYEPCEYFGDSIEWATFGDSHVVEMSYALAQFLRPGNTGVQHNSWSNCHPSVTGSDVCSEWTNATLDRLESDERIKNVVITYRLTAYLQGESLGRYPELPGDVADVDQSRMWQALIAIFQRLLDAGKTVYFVVQPPELPMYVEKIAYWNDDGEGSLEGASKDWWLQRNAYVLQRLDELPEPVNVVDTTDLFCDTERCYGSDPEGYLYFDDDHVSIHGARRIVESMFSESR